MHDRIAKAFEIASSTYEGKFMREEMEKTGVKIVLEETEEDSGPAAYARSTRTMLVSSTAVISDEDMLSIVLHEPRHMFQHNRLKGDPNSAKMNVYEHMALTRIFEGDAYAFQCNMEQKIKGGTPRGFRVEFRDFQERESQLNNYGLGSIKHFLNYYAKNPTAKTPMERLCYAFGYYSKAPLSPNLPDVRPFLVPGVDDKALCYLGRRSNESIWAEACDHVRQSLPGILKKLGVTI